MQCGNNFGEEVRISRVVETDDFSSFHCGVEEMDSFIHDGLRQSADNHFCVLYKVTIAKEIIALFALSFDALYLDYDDRNDLQQGSGESLVEEYADVFWDKHQRHRVLSQVEFYCLRISKSHKRHLEDVQTIVPVKFTAKCLSNQGMFEADT